MAARPRLTAGVQETIVAYVRAGGFPHVAAEAAGVPRAVFERWLELGEGPQGKPRYRALAEAVRQAQAQARLGAEVTALTERPLDWLRNGPGKPAPGQAGWTATARAAQQEAQAGPAMARAEVQELVTTLLRLLEPYPEVRAAVASALAGKQEGG